MRILFPTLARFPNHEAPAVQVANMAQAFAELGHEVLLVAPVDDGTPPTVATLRELYGFTPGFAVRILSRRVHRGQSYLHALRIAQLAVTWRADLVFSRNLRACLLPALRGTPTVFEVHTLNALTGPQERWLLRRLARAPRPAGFVAISQALADDVVAAVGIPPDRILVAHDAVRTVESGAVAELPPTPARIRVGYTGSMFPGRGVEQLIALAEREPRVVLHLVGGPEEAARAWASRAPRADGEGRLVIHGPVGPERARALQRAMDVLAAPFARRVATDSGIDSSRWMSPMKVFEYMASGVPMVVSDLPVLREVLRPDVDALMVPPEDVDALVAAVGRLADDPGLGRRLAASAGERVRREGTWELRAQRILARSVPDRSVALLLPSFGAGGAERVLLNVAAGLVGRGVRVRVIALDGRGPLRAQVASGVEVVDLGRRRVRTAAAALVRELRRDRPSTVLASQTHLNVLVALIRPLLPRGVRVVVREPTLLREQDDPAWRRRVLRHALRRVDAVIASSGPMRDHLATLVGRGDAVHDVPNPVDVMGLRAGLGSSTTTDGAATLHAVVVGRLVAEKGHADLLDAVAIAGREVRVTVVGDGPLRAALEGRVAALGLRDRVRFVGRIDDRAELARLVAGADLLVQPSLFEGMPNTVLEALALGTPVLATTDLTVLHGLATEVGPAVLRLVPRTLLGGALAAAPVRDGARPGPSLLPERFTTAAVVDRLLDVLLPSNA